MTGVDSEKAEVLIETLQPWMTTLLQSWNDRS